MTDIKKRKLKRIIFPIGLFFVLFLIESILGITGVSSYIYLAGKKNIADIENYTINYSKTTAEAFARVAEFSYSGKKYTALKALFHEKIEENTVDEAFFVLSNGKIVVHSSTTTEKMLKWNIASDEMSYNIDMILKPVETKSKELILNNYNIIGKFIPFKRLERNIIKKYVYKDINYNGWLFSKCIFHKNKPIGTVNFIICKERIYVSLRQSIDMLKYYSLLIIAVSAITAFLISLIVFFRYRSIQLNALQYDTYKDFSDEEDYTGEYEHPVKGDIVFDDIETFKEDSKSLMDDFDDFDMIDNEIENSSIEKKEKIERIRSEDLTEVYEPKRSSSQIDEEFITVEFLGEIESNKVPAVEEKKKTERVKEYIATAVNLNDYKKSMNKEIRDAIPDKRKKM